MSMNIVCELLFEYPAKDQSGYLSIPGRQGAIRDVEIVDMIVSEIDKLSAEDGIIIRRETDGIILVADSEKMDMSSLIELLGNLQFDCLTKYGVLIHGRIECGDILGSRSETCDYYRFSESLITISDSIADRIKEKWRLIIEEQDTHCINPFISDPRNNNESPYSKFKCFHDCVRRILFTEEGVPVIEHPDYAENLGQFVENAKKYSLYHNFLIMFNERCEDHKEFKISLPFFSLSILESYNQYIKAFKNYDGKVSTFRMSNSLNSLIGQFKASKERMGGSR